LNFITKNLSLKIIAFLFALMFWFNVVTNKTYEHEFDIPFNLNGISSELILTTPPPEKLSVKLSGTGKQMLTYILKKPTLVMEGSQYERGIYRVEISPEDLAFDDEIQARVASVSHPQDLTFKFETLSEKDVPIIPEVKITPALGFVQVGEMAIFPETVKVSGPHRIIRSLKSLSTKRVVFDGVKKDIEENISLIIDDTLFLTSSSNTVSVKQNIVPLTEKKLGPINIQTFNSNKYDSTFMQPESIYVVVEGPRGFIDSLDLSQFSASINFRNIEPGTTSVMPKVVSPSGYRLIGTDPAAITVTAIQQ
jgi:YbbR domain-containing protein